MHATSCFPLFFPHPMAGVAAPGQRSKIAEPLIHLDKLTEYVGDDPDTHKQVFDLCLNLVTTSIPELRRAIDVVDAPTVRRIAHHARGSLGMLGLPRLIDVGEDIEYRYDDLGAETWRLRCEELYGIFQHLRVELIDRLAA